MTSSANPANNELIFRTNSLPAKTSKIHAGLDKKETKGIVPNFYLETRFLKQNNPITVSPL